MTSRRPHAIFHPHDWVDRVFAVGIVAKGLDGVLELIGGVLLLLVSPASIQGWVVRLTQGELSEDPHDLVARYLLHSSSDLSASSVHFGAAYLLAHGVVKVVLVAALLRERLWAYPWMIAVLISFIVYQLYRIALRPTGGMIGLTVFDVVVTVLTVVEYRRHRRARRSGETSAPATEAGTEPPDRHQAEARH